MAITTQERTELMVQMYGEVCTRAEASRILRRNIRTVKNMLEDGRIDEACGGTMVDVRSIARYISAPKQEDTEARKRRVKRKYNSGFAV